MRRFLTPRWLLWHLAALTLVAAFLALGWWQIRRAQGGNALSFGYAIEWPVFALFVVFVWSREIRAERRRGAGAPDPAPAAATGPAGARLLTAVPVRERPAGPAGDPDQDPELREYNRYLEWLNADPQRRPADYRPAARA